MVIFYQPNLHQRQRSYTFWAIDGDTLGIVRIQHGTAIAIEDLGKVTHKSFVLCPLPNIAIFRFGWGGALAMLSFVPMSLARFR